MIRLPDQTEYAWRREGVVQWSGLERSFGIVARSTQERGRDARTPDAIRASFLEFLDVAYDHGFKAVHVQLLAAGKKRVFAPWISLVQMARASASGPSGRQAATPSCRSTCMWSTMA